MLDDLDRALVHALHIDGRAPFSRIAEVLGVSGQTVARRYRRLREEAGLRVVGLADPHTAGRTRWLLRLTATPGSARDLAAALVRRPDTSWVKLVSGGTQIVAVVHGSDPLLLDDVPRTPGVTAVTAHLLLHTYIGGPAHWRRSADTLDSAQQLALRDEESDVTPRQISDGDRDLLAALARDGRTALADPAGATGWTAATVARRLAELRAGGGLFLDVEIDAAHFGVATRALLWMSVRPSRLDEVASALSAHDELAFLAAVTGPANLVAQALCRDPADLHRYLTRELGALDAIDTLEAGPVLRTLKAASPSLALRPPRR
ncbi:Lrp/AsnC family transcriptional regulator [Streptomyces sp. 4F14]|uniref:Lrp/AsnC family transcriptional regulator n=1 Tax=Streptomyces sp. 4F14 TaxID=3394380 RepID=UPI003A84443E